MKLTFLATGLAYGGGETQLVRLAIQLKSRGWEVQVVSLMPPRAYVEELDTAGIPVFSLGIRRKLPDPRPILRLARLIRAWRPEIVHSHMVHANILARIVRPLVKVPVLVCTAQNIDERGRKGSGRLREFLYRLTDPFCDLTTQVSQAGLERYVQIGAVPRHKIRYIPNGVDTASFKSDLEARLRLRQELRLEGAFVWLAVGRFDVQKDYPNMLRAFAQVVKKQSETFLLIVGDGPLRPAMEKLARDLGLKDQIRFLGIRRDVPELMSAADAYVMSSTWEGMPMVLLEASAAELPIVATNVGGNGEVVLDGKSGFLVPPNDPEALAQAMLRLMSLSEEERWRMGKLARQHIEARYSLDRVVNQWEALYRELLAKKGIRVE
jgi:glycosyltransferase involved in cell wall biosynthesis